MYNVEKEELLQKFETTMSGLSDAKVKEQTEKFGPNIIQEEKERSLIKIFLSQFADLLVLILISAAIISFLTGNTESTYVIIGVILVNAILGTVQQIKAEKSLKSLKAMSAPKAKVIRNGVKQEILAQDITILDIVMLEAGDIVPADGRILENFSLQVNESSLTGESESVTKDDKAILKENVALADQNNMVFSGTLVTYGRANVLVTSIGMDTEIGKIANLMNMTAQRKTPLQVSLDDFSKKLAVGVVIISAIVFALEYSRGTPVLDSLMFAVALAVAAIPEALSSIVTIALAIGTTKMSKQNAVIKDLKAVEGLGAVSVICSDKTGTLTQNKMTVNSIFSKNSDDRLQLISVLCNDSYKIEDSWAGDPTEIALSEYYIKQNKDINSATTCYPRLQEIPFDSDRKLMSTVHNINNQQYLLTKGAIDVLLNKTISILENDNVRPISEKDKSEILEISNKLSRDGYRVLAFAQKEIYDNVICFECEENYTFVGLVSMIDPPRIESAKAVKDCYTAGIKPVMITGDHKVTASAIAKQIGILKEDDIALDGAEIDALSDDELMQLLPRISVYARVTPQHKIRIVTLWQTLGNVVAMTGDGVNDAPALKKADIGIAMGITGTAVSKDAASVILTDDNFATIIKAVENGRNIYENIKNSIKFLLSGNMAAIIAVLYTAIVPLPIPFTAVHLLFINLLTDSLPAIAISMEDSNKDILKKRPRAKNEGILNKNSIFNIASQGFLIAIFTIIAYYIGMQVNTATQSTMAFATLCLARLFHAFNLRGEGSIFKLGLFKNKYSILAFIAGVLFLASALLIPPLQVIFEVTPLSTNNLFVVFACAIMPTIIIQTIKIIKENLHKTKN